MATERVEKVETKDEDTSDKVKNANAVIERRLNEDFRASLNKQQEGFIEKTQNSQKPVGDPQELEKAREAAGNFINDPINLRRTSGNTHDAQSLKEIDPDLVRNVEITENADQTIDVKLTVLKDGKILSGHHRHLMSRIYAIQQKITP